MTKRVIALLLFLAPLINAYQNEKLLKQDKFPSLLPQVKELTYGEEKMIVDHCNLKFEHSDQIDHPALITLKQSFLNLAFKNNCDKISRIQDVNAIKTIKIDVEEVQSLPLKTSLKDTDESYTLSITEDGIHIFAKHYSGVPRAFSTLIQMIKKSHDDRGYHHISHLPIQINDSPRYPYRGLMIDTSRRFYTAETLKDIIQYMALAKFNAFHWHITDDDSFPMELQSRPTITENGAFAEDQVYTKEIIQDVVDYASSWGVRVIPEFDIPGHTRSIGLEPSLNYLIRCFDRDWPYSLHGAYKIKGGPPTGVIDPYYAESYDMVEDILKDMNSYFPDDLIHLGGDEVFSSCFSENPNIQDFMAWIGVSTYDELVSYFISEIRARLTSMNSNKQVIYWSNADTFNLRYQDNDILMFWGLSHDIDTLKSIYPNNYLIFSLGDYNYLDCGMGNKYGGGSWCDPYKTWWTIRSFDPEPYLGKDEFVLGGEVPMWSELSGDGNIHSKLWPRVTSLADVYWGQYEESVDLVAITERLNAFGSMLEGWGVPISPITGRWCELDGERCWSEYGVGQTH